MSTRDELVLRRIAIIVAMDRNGVIGYRGKLPWPKIPPDLQWFRKHTMGNPIIMGRRTFTDGLSSRPLPFRTNIILTRNASFEAPKVEGCVRATSFGQALQLACQAANTHADDTESMIFVIGGAEIYREALPSAQFLYLTRIDAEYEGDTIFSGYNEREWQRVQPVQLVQWKGTMLSFDIYRRCE
ncbi:MAG: dihydrofolate reductase [Patescibacteria group bacterium]